MNDSYIISLKHFSKVAANIDQFYLRNFRDLTFYIMSLLGITSSLQSHSTLSANFQLDWELKSHWLVSIIVPLSGSAFKIHILWKLV